MFQTIPVREENIFAFKATGKLTDADYQQFLPELTTLIHKYGPISLLVELEDFHGWEPKAAWDDFKFGKQHDKDFIRIAIVGEKHWQKWMTVISNAFSETQIHSFSREELQEAWDWLREGDQKEDLPSGRVVESEKVDLKPYRHVLVAVDFSPHSDLALQRSLELARHYNANLSLVHAVEYTNYFSTEYDSVVLPHNFMEIDQSIFDHSSSHLDQIAKDLNYPNTQHEVLWGRPRSTILSYATAQNVDLIVVGSHGRHGLTRLLGSTATGIMHNAKCDVIIVKLPG